jgi:putative DNA primase/helicase
MTLRELLDTLKGLGATLTLHDGDTISIEPPDVLIPAVRAALSEHHAALVALIRSGPSSPSSFDALMTALDGLEARPAAEILQGRLRTLAAGLVGADPLVRELVRAEAIARLTALDVRAPARIVDAALTARPSDPGGTGPGRSLLFADPDPWPETVDGAALLDALAHTYRRFVSLPEGGAEALALWVVFTYALEAFDVAPILALCSPLKRCGKTTTEEVTTALAQRPLAAANVTVAALYRTVEQFAPTLIVDEADTFLLTNLALRGIINSGHTRATAFVVRIAGHEPRLFSTWGARMIALIGRLPATLEDRAIVLPMRRRAPGETVDRIRRDGLRRQCDPLRRRTGRWVAEHLPALRAADPAVPEELDDRQADNWRPLLAIADAAGGTWPALARTAARTLAGPVVEADTAAPVRLLADLRDLFATTTADRLATAAIIRHLTALEDQPWADAQGRPMTPRQLAKLLEGFGIKAKQIRQGAETRKGYRRADFTDVFCRYLPRDPKHPKHRNGAAELAIDSERRRAEAVSGRGHPTSPQPTSNVSDVSGAHHERGANEG